MADRPTGSGTGNDEEPPKYDWLYGQKGSGGDDPDATRVVPRQPRPDETQVMPVQPRQSKEPNPVRRTPATPPPVAPPPRSGGRSGRSLGGFRPRFRLRYVWLLLLLWIVYLVAVPFVAMSRVSSVDAFPSGSRPDDQGGSNYLLVGSDSRKGLTPAQRKELHTGGDVGQRTDTILILHVGSGPDLLMSIPRDSLVAVPGHGTTKINAAFAYGGPKLLVQTIEQDTKIHIDHYVEIGFGGFVNVVDAVGGINICPKTNMDDKLANLHIKKGCQDVDGRVALAYARSRHTSNLGDIGRAQHQREVVSAVGHKAISPWTFLNPFRYWSLNMSAADSLTTDKDTGPFDLGRFAWAMTHVNGTNGLTCGVPISDLAVHWDSTRAPQMFKHIIDDDTSGIGSLCSPSGLPKSVTG